MITPVMAYMLGSVAFRLVPQRSSKNPLDPCREHQGSFILLLLCAHLALHEHIVIELGLDNETIRPTVYVSTAEEKTDQKDLESQMC